MLALKLVLVPTILALVSMAGRRWGPAVGGWLGGFPLVACPIFVLLSIEQGPRFAADTAAATLSAVGGTVVYVTAYARLCVRAPWLATVTAALAAWLASAIPLVLLALPPVPALAFTALTLALGKKVVPEVTFPPGATGLPRSELVLRMLAGAAVTVLITGLSDAVGSTWTGLMAVFPTMGLVLAVCSHRAQGGQYAQVLLRGMLNGLFAFTTFCFALTVALPRLGIVGGFAAALGAAGAVHWYSLGRIRRAAMTRAMVPERAG
ncbi:MAG: hypothetical protein H6983_06085 [Ectothiorhodospiraceae bacterium]|nr:hypothetical protein [Chromatiales bacterium]MCP5153713.1 hypothetical protein [Ectothiorhodospiraceae bacterium]